MLTYLLTVSALDYNATDRLLGSSNGNLKVYKHTRVIRPHGSVIRPFFSWARPAEDGLDPSPPNIQLAVKSKTADGTQIRILT